MKLFNKTNISLLLIILVGVILRFVCLDKSSGLDYDEIVGTYNSINQRNLLSVLFYTLKTDIHFPMYQILLHYWGKIFSFSDIALRAFSAFCGSISVAVAFFIGKELKSTKTGLICSSIFAINSFLIYYSQEVRMYGFVALLSSIYLLSLIKIKNDYQNKNNYLFALISAIFVIATNPISFIFVFIQIFALFAYLAIALKENKLFILKKTLVTTGQLIFLCLPFFIIMLLNQSKYSLFFGNFYCDWTTLLVMMQNWFTPALEFNTHFNFIQTISSLNAYSIFFIITPITIAIGAIIYSVKKDRFSIVLLITAVLFLICEVILSTISAFKPIPRYTMAIVPNLLVLVGYGFSLIENKNWKKTTLSTFILINLIYLIFMSNSAFKIQRQGLKPLAEILTSNNVKKDDFTVIWNNTTILNKYMSEKLNYISLLQNVAYTSEYILYNQTELDKMSVEQKKKVLRNYFASHIVPENTKYLINFIYQKAKPKQKFVIITTKYFDSFTQESFTDLVNNDEEYNKTGLNYLFSIKAIIDLKQVCYAKFKFVKLASDKDFNVYIFEK